MVTKAHGKNGGETVLASLSPDMLDKLADLVVAKLTRQNGRVLLPKQDVVGSNPITRFSTRKTSVHGAHRGIRCF